MISPTLVSMNQNEINNNDLSILLVLRGETFKDIVLHKCSLQRGIRVLNRVVGMTSIAYGFDSFSLTLDYVHYRRRHFISLLSVRYKR